MFRKKQRSSPVVARPASAQATYSDDRAVLPVSPPASADKTNKKKTKKQKDGEGVKVKRGGSFRIGSFRKSRPPIEVVTGSFQSVASITTDGQDPRQRQVEFRITSAGRSPGFSVERKARPSSRHNLAGKGSQNGGGAEAAGGGHFGIFVSEIEQDGVVAEQQLLHVGDEIVSVNGLGVSVVVDVRDVELLLRGGSRIKLTIIPASSRPAYVPGEVKKELFPDVIQYHGSPQARSRRKSPRPSTDGNGDAVGANDGGKLRQAHNNNGKVPDSYRQSPARSPVSNASTLVDENGVGGAAAAAADVPDSEAKDGRSYSVSGAHAAVAAEAAAAVNGHSAASPRTESTDRKGGRIKRRNSVLKKAGLAESSGDTSQMQDMVSVFVDQGENMNQGQKQTLLAQCLAEEFDLKFFDDLDTGFKLDLDGFDDI